MKDSTAILLAAGRGTRLGFDKILTPLAGKPVLHYSLEALEGAESIAEIVIPTRPDIRDDMERCVEAAGLRKPYRILEGGAERQDSVLAGLEASAADLRYALIHDSARALVTVELIEKVLRAARDHGGALCGRPCTDTLKQCGDDQSAVKTVDRSRFWQVETPQAFEREPILAAYRKVKEEKLLVTDDASAWEAVGKQARLVDTGDLNLKITRSQDWMVAHLWLSRTSGEDLCQDIHGLNNALSPLVGYLPLIEANPASEKSRGYFGKINAGLDRALPLLEQLRERARAIFPKQKKDH